MTGPSTAREPDFAQFLKVLNRQEPDRPTLFEFYLNHPLYERLAGRPAPAVPDASAGAADRADRLAAFRSLGKWYADAFAAAGYDYVNFGSATAFPGFHYRVGAHEKAASHSLNEGALVSSWEEYERFDWPTTDRVDFGILDALTADVPEGMQAMVFSPNGIMENLVDLVGYDNLCYLLVDDRRLVEAVATRIGESLLSLYRAFVDHPRLGAIIANDDWGFKTQTMIAPDDVREFVLPTHREIVRLAHAAGKPALLHSCGQLVEVMDDVIDGAGYDAKHSFEDVILPVEEVYERWGDRIAILGGIDVGFLCEASPQEITARSRAMLERTAGRGGYALGSGNSIPEYVPQESYFAMIRAALA